MKRTSFTGIILFLAFCGGCALLAANIMLGDLNQDEGWYLYAARMVRMGYLPYRDFAYTQGPVMPFVYSLAEPFVQRHGLIGGRIFTALLGLIGALMASILGFRLAQSGRKAEAAALTLMLILLNVYQSSFFAVVKTYSLTSFFLLSGFLALSFALEFKSKVLISVAAILLVLAAGVRTSAGIILPIVLGFLFFEKTNRSFRGWIWFGAVGVAAGVAMITPFIIMAPENFWFCVVAYHALRETGGFLQAIVYKAGFISRIAGAYFVAIGLLVSVLSARFFIRFMRDLAEPGDVVVAAKLSGSKEENGVFRKQDWRRPFILLLWICVAAVTCVHFMAPFPYDDYQVFIFPLFATGVAVAFVHLMSRPAHRAAGAWVLLAIFLICSVASLSSQLNQDWFVQGRDRIWWRLKEKTPIQKLRETGAMIKDMAGPDNLLLTQDPYLAVESGLMLPAGLEMGQFSYFPNLSDESAEKLHVMNRSRMKNLLKNCEASVAALSGYAFAIQSPQIEPVSSDDMREFREEMFRRYEYLYDIPDFGQAFTTLQIFKKRCP